MEESPQDLELFHYGVKGMKWGIRKKANTSAGHVKKTSRRERYKAIRNKELRSFTVKAKNGKEVQVSEDKTPVLGAFILSFKKDAVKLDAEGGQFSFKVDGKHVGEASFGKKNDEELNLQWLGVKSSERGKGYGSAVFDSAVEYGRAEGYKRLTLEVPGKSPDARHIYEKRGFKVVKEPSPEEIAEDTLFGGLTHMALEIDDVKHSSISEDEEIEKALIQTFPQLPSDLEESVFRQEGSESLKTFPKLADSKEVYMSSPNDLELFHYGVKGMRWGVIRRKPSSEKSNGSRSSSSKTSNSSEGPKKKPPLFNKREKAALAVAAVSTLHMTHPRQMTAGRKFIAQSISTTAAFSREFRYRHKESLRRAKDFAATNGLPRPGDIPLNLVDGVWR